jgi:hypothetical protein
MIQISIYDSPDFTQTLVFDGKSYDVWLQWNGRDESWRMSLGRSGQSKRCRFKVTNGIDLLAPYRAYEDTPDGYIYCVDVEKVYGRVSKQELIDGRFALLYLTEEEYETLKG